jgi:hypothetical protein
MSFRVLGLDPAPFAPLAALSDEALVSRAMRRMIADGKPGYPCRVSLDDAEPGERVLLVGYHHQAAHSPYNAGGPIFVRETAKTAYDKTDEIPFSLRVRPISLRAYDEDGLIVNADLVEGGEVEPVIRQYLARGDVSYLHAHYARRGCYACRIERA